MGLGGGGGGWLVVGDCASLVVSKEWVGDGAGVDELPAEADEGGEAL